MLRSDTGRENRTRFVVARFLSSIKSNAAVREKFFYVSE